MKKPYKMAAKFNFEDLFKKGLGTTLYISAVRIYHTENFPTYRGRLKLF